MAEAISKSRFKPHSLEYFRRVEQTGEELIITDRGQPVLKVVPYHEEPAIALQRLRNSVISFVDPLQPVSEDDWDAQQ